MAVVWWSFLLCKKFKKQRMFETQVGLLGFFFFFSVALVFVFCFFPSDYRREVGKGFGFGSGSGRDSAWRQVVMRGDGGYGGGAGVKRVDFLGKEGEATECHVFDGDWVWDERYPLYESRDCRFLDDGFRCSENGRPDRFFTKWRWQPKNCNLPRFDAKLMLERLRNRRLAFVGDSIGRNQWESLLCMLSSAVPNKSSIYEVNGSPITKHRGFLVFRFEEFNCTVEYYRAPFLVLQSRPPKGSPKNVKMTLKLDRMDWSSSKWRDADVLVFNSGHWWNYEKTLRGGCYFQEGSKVKPELRVDEAYAKAMETVLQWIHSRVNTNTTHVFFRTFSPVHFRGGDWRNGGTCHKETLPDLGSTSTSTAVPASNWAQYKIFSDIVSAHSDKDAGLDLLNITHMTSSRKDGHSSLYYQNLTGGEHESLHRQDCSHWCLPGVPDSWNELLFAMFLKRESDRWRNSSIDHLVHI